MGGDSKPTRAVTYSNSGAGSSSSSLIHGIATVSFPWLRSLHNKMEEEEEAGEEARGEGARGEGAREEEEGGGEEEEEEEEGEEGEEGEERKRGEGGKRERRKREGSGRERRKRRKRLGFIERNFDFGGSFFEF